MTADLQALDARVLRQLKCAGAKIWVERYLSDPTSTFTKADAPIDLQTC
jgi:hypothetical protein